MTLLHKCCLANNLKLCKVLIENDSIILDAETDQGLTALDIACHNSNTDILAMLLDRGCSVNYVSRKSLNKCPYLLKYLDKETIATILLQRGADINYVMQVNGDGLLHLACIENSTLKVKLLIAKGVDVSIRNHQGRNALHTAVATGASVHLIASLIATGIDINEEDNESCTALHLACDRCTTRIDIIDLLINSGANVNAQTSKKFTPLYLAAKNLNYEIFKHLLEKGSDISIIGPNGNSVFHILFLHKENKDKLCNNDNEYSEILLVSAFIEKIGKLQEASLLFKTNGDGLTPFHILANYGYLQLMKNIISMALN